MFGAFRPSNVNLGGLLWKTPWKLSVTRKANARSRLKKVDAVIEAVRASGVYTASLGRALELPKEHEMPARDKYTVFTPHEKDTERESIRFPNGQEFVIDYPPILQPITETNVLLQLTLRTNPKGF